MHCGSQSYYNKKVNIWRTQIFKNEKLSGNPPGKVLIKRCLPGSRKAGLLTISAIQILAIESWLKRIIHDQQLILVGLRF